MKLNKSILAIGAFALVAGVTSFAATSAPAYAGNGYNGCQHDCGDNGGNGNNGNDPAPAAGPALQTIGQLQLNGGQDVNNSGGNTANTNGNAFEEASGNVGNNVAAGNANQQANEAYIEYGGSSEDVLAVAPQLNGFNSIDKSGGNKAGTGGNAFEYATGNVGSNTAAGNDNQQTNDAVLLNGNLLVGLTMGSVQLTGLSCYNKDGGNTATAGGSSFYDAVGNIGNNVAAGNANQQSNQLVVNNMSAASSFQP